MCPPVRLADLEPPELPVFCPCFHCTPTHVANDNASYITRLRCLLLNWLHGYQILTSPPSPDIQLFRGLQSSICKTEDMRDDRTLRILGFDESPEVDRIQMTISTYHCPTSRERVVPGDQSDQPGDLYDISAFIRVFNAEGRLLELVKEDGEGEILRVMFCMIFRQGDHGNNAQEMRSWEKIVELLRKVSDAVYNRAAEVISDPEFGTNAMRDQECGRRIREITQPVMISDIHAG